jgi:hypothetical protein
MQDDVLLSLALTLPKKKDVKKDDQQQQEEEEKQKPEGKYFVKRKDDGSGAIYEAAIPWSLWEKNGAAIDAKKGPAPGFQFGFNIILADDDGERISKEEEDLAAGKKEGDWRGAQKTLELTPSVLLHEKKSRLWQGYIPEHFAKITVR